MLSGPIDVDKIDYLMRDSLHAGVPYGQHFDRRRLISSLCLNEAGDGLAITDKGKTAAEMMVFARYVMFSEVYWHHAVRSATAMFQRAVFLLHDELDLERELVPLTRTANDRRTLRPLPETPGWRLARRDLRPTRQLYKRLAQYSYFEEPEMYRRLARRPYRGAGSGGGGESPRRSARRSDNALRRTKCWSTPRRPSWKSTSTSSVFPEGATSIGGWATYRPLSARWRRSSSTTT